MSALGAPARKSDEEKKGRGVEKIKGGGSQKAIRETGAVSSGKENIKTVCISVHGERVTAEKKAFKSPVKSQRMWQKPTVHLQTQNIHTRLKPNRFFFMCCLFYFWILKLF